MIEHLTEVKLHGDYATKEVMAKCDSGSESTSIHYDLIVEIGGAERLGQREVYSALGSEKRDTVQTSIELAGKRFDTKVDIGDRSGMDHKVLIGCDILKNFLIAVT
ncbi:metalloprotease [Salinarchaeum sp. Harcht-Bsk1]|nr:metalloprotease [Salinarchaeum sp. Harcht-Bsk1]